jgi:hypothetical protein
LIFIFAKLLPNTWVFFIAHYRPLFGFGLDYKYSLHGQKPSISHRLDLFFSKLIQFYGYPRLKTFHNFYG